MVHKGLPNLSGIHDKKSFHINQPSFSSAGKDYYSVLGVAKDAASKDIKKAYYQLAKKYHPDTNKGDKQAQKKFQEVSEAYECLSDDTKRKQYDAFGAGGNAFSGSGGFPGAGAGGFGGAWNFKSSIDPEELFRTIFGDKNWQSAAGGDPFGGQFDFGAQQEYQMSLTFSEAARGCKKDLNVTVMDTCSSCKGSGCEGGSEPEKCPQCHGTGMETVSTGPFMMRSTCRRCHGQGTVIKNPCRDCRGRGLTKQKKSVIVPVPAGIEDGQTVRMPVGKKEIFITFRVNKSETFRRQGSDVHSDAKISLTQAILGGRVRLKGIYDDINLQIPPGTASHTRMMLKGKGIQRVSGYGYGDHYIHIKIEVPKALTEKQQALIKAYTELEKDTPGTVNGFTYDKDGGKVLMEDRDGFVQEIREALEDHNKNSNQEDGKGNAS